MVEVIYNSADTKIAPLKEPEPKEKPLRDVLIAKGIITEADLA